MAAVTPLPPTPVDPLTPLGKLRVRRLGSQESHRSRGGVDNNNQSSSGNPPPSNDFSSVRGVDVFGDDIAHDYVGRFPFLDHKRWREYRLHQKMFFDPYTSAFPVTLLFMAQFTRFNLYQSYFAGPYFSVAFSIPFAGVPTFSLMLFMYGAKSVISDPSHWLRALARRWRHTCWGQMLDSLVLLLVTLQYGFVLYGRVAAGPCPPGTSIWDTQTCNPVADSHSIPQDQVLLLYMVPVLVQICVKAVHLHALAAAWVVVAAFVVAALQCVDGWRQLWTLLYLVLVVFISFEYERHSRVTFLESKKASLAEKAKRIALEEAIEAELQMQQERHRAEILSLAAVEDKRLADREREQLTALVGNVAHDLKTPLQSFRMDLDLLEMILVRSGRSRDEASGSVSGSSDSQWNPLTVVKSLDTACCFMVMAINRSIEFVKTSQGIALTPNHDTFDLAVALAEPIGMMKGLQYGSGGEVTLLPLSPTICKQLVSDPHWFKESLLCLLSNATKYSSGAPVTVAVDLVMFCRLPKPRGGMALAPATLAHFHSQGRFSITPNVAADGVPAIALARYNSQGTAAGLPSFTPSAAVDGVPASAPASNKGFLDGPGRRGSYGRGHGHVLGPTDRQSDSTRPAAPTPHPHPHPLPHPHAPAPPARHPAPAPRALFLMVTVEDEGIGIELDKRTELFQPFKQAQRLTGGTGLGLYSLSKRMEALKGFCGLEDRRDGRQGCSFWFAFPYVPDAFVQSGLAEVRELEAAINGLVAADGAAAAGDMEEEEEVDEPGQKRQRAEGAEASPTPAVPPVLMPRPSSRMAGLGPASSRSTSPRGSTKRGRRWSRGSSAERDALAHQAGLLSDADIEAGGGLPGLSASYKYMKQRLYGAFERRQLTLVPQPVSGAERSGPRSLVLQPSREQEGVTGGVSLAVSSWAAAVSRHGSNVEAAVAQAGGAPPVPAGALRVLLVDDSLPVLKVTGRALKLNGHVVDVASNGAVALGRLCQAFTQHAYYDVCILDLHMPVMDGVECARRYRAFEAAALPDRVAQWHATAAGSGNEDPVAVAGVAGPPGSTGSSHRPMMLMGSEKDAASSQPSASDQSHSSKSQSLSRRPPRTVRPTRPPRALSIIGMSAGSDAAANRDLALGNGHDAFVNKPFAFAELMAAIDRVVRPDGSPPPPPQQISPAAFDDEGRGSEGQQLAAARAHLLMHQSGKSDGRAAT